MKKIKNKSGDRSAHLRPTTDYHPADIYNYPIFCFKHIHKDYCLENCERDEKVQLIQKICKLSTMTWDQIRVCGRHALGYEKINRNSIRASIPHHITPDIEFIAFRFDGLKPMVGYKSKFIFHIVYLDRNFDLYDH